MNKTRRVALASLGIVLCGLVTAVPARAFEWSTYADIHTHNGEKVQSPRSVTISSATTQLPDASEVSIFTVWASVGHFAQSRHSGRSANASVPNGPVLSYPTGWWTTDPDEQGETRLVGQYFGDPARGPLSAPVPTPAPGVTEQTTVALPEQIETQLAHLTSEAITEVHHLGDHNGTTYWSARAGKDGVVFADRLADGTTSVGLTGNAAFSRYGTGASTSSVALPGERTAYLIPEGVELTQATAGVTAHGQLIFDDRPEGSDAAIALTDTRPATLTDGDSGDAVPKLEEIASLR